MQPLLNENPSNQQVFNQQKVNLKMAWPVVIMGGTLGFITAWSLLSGDQQGRVNLSYLLLVYLFIPVLSLMVACISLIKGKGINLARLVIAFPLLAKSKNTLIRKVQQLKIEKYWLLFQSQLAAIAFSIASLSVFFILLLVTDINFVWRSTLLEATDLYPLLKLLSTPWFFWHEAQPSIELLKMTENSRLLINDTAPHKYAEWWQFIFAVQLFYCLLLRSLLLVLSAWVFKRKLNNDIESQLSHQLNQQKTTSTTNNNLTAPVTNIPSQLMLNNWAGVALELLQTMPKIELSPDYSLKAGPLATEAEQRIAERWQGEQLVIVKSWEPPMGELEDFLANGQGYVLPLDWHQTKLQLVKIEHLEEWQRFVGKLSAWQVYLPPSLMPKMLSS